MTNVVRIADLPPAEIERLYPDSPEAQHIRDVRARQLKHIRETAPHWQQPRPIQRRESPPAPDSGASLGSVLGRMIRQLDRDRTQRERDRQAGLVCECGESTLPDQSRCAQCERRALERERDPHGIVNDRDRRDFAL